MNEESSNEEIINSKVEGNSNEEITNSETEAASENITQVQTSDIIYQPSDIKNVEVHHHPQLEHKPKPWKEYLLEGLMIFLAVTLGFFAENLRERISDGHRANEFANELYAELKGDSTVAAHMLSIRIEKQKDMDYLNSYFKDSSLTTLPREFYASYTTSLYLINSYAFEPKDGILEQLKSSGSLRFFKSVALQKLLGDMSVCINNIRYRNEQEYQYFASPLKPFLLKHYEFGWLNQLRKEDNIANSIDLINNYRKSDRLTEAEILNLSSLSRGEVCNMILFYKQMMVSTQSLQLNNYIVTNKKILESLRENYSLENE